MAGAPQASHHPIATKMQIQTEYRQLLSQPIFKVPQEHRFPNYKHPAKKKRHSAHRDFCASRESLPHGTPAKIQ